MTPKCLTASENESNSVTRPILQLAIRHLTGCNRPKYMFVGITDISVLVGFLLNDKQTKEHFFITILNSCSNCR